MGGRGPGPAPPPASTLFTHAPSPQHRRRAILPGLNVRWNGGRSGLYGCSPRPRFSSLIPYFHQVRPGRARPGRVASGNPAGEGLRHSLHSRALGSKDRASGRERNVACVSGGALEQGLCLRSPASPRLVSSRLASCCLRSGAHRACSGSRAAAARPNAPERPPLPL